MHIRKRRHKNVIILYPEGNIDINCANFIEETGQLVKNDYFKIVCNFSSVSMVDYNGLSIIAVAYKNAINNNALMKFCNVPLHIKDLFKLSRLDLVFDMYNNERDALNSFKTSTKIDKLYLRRRFKRLDLHLSVKYIRSAATKAKLFSGKILNISGEGIFVYSHDTLPMSTELVLEITFEDEPVPLKIKGAVIWLADKELQPHCYPGMGIQFIDLKSSAQKKVIEFIDKNISTRSNI